MSTEFFSARARNALMRHQRQVIVQMRDLHSADRILIGALTACDASGQRESAEAYVEAVQELRVSLERLEAFLLQRLSRPLLEREPPGGEAMVSDLDPAGV